MGFNVENWSFCCSLLPPISLIAIIMVQNMKSSCSWGDIMSVLNLLLQFFDDIYLLLCFFFISLLKVKTVGPKLMKDRLLSVWKQLLWVGCIYWCQKTSYSYFCLEECKVKGNLGNLMFVLFNFAVTSYLIAVLLSISVLALWTWTVQLALWLLGIMCSNKEGCTEVKYGSKEFGNSLKIKLIHFLRRSVQVLTGSAFKTILSKPS